MPYALLLHLRPIASAPGSFSPRHAHGLFFSLLQKIDPALATRVHEAKRKPFTLTPLPQRDSLVLRVTTLDDTLFAPLLGVILVEAGAGLGLGEERYCLTQVVATPEGDGLAGHDAWEALAQPAPTWELTLRFLTPTVFATSKPGGRTRYTPLPEPRLILKSLLDSWQVHSPFPYPQGELMALREAFEFDAEIAGFHGLRHHRVEAGKGVLPGFTGTVSLRLWGENVEAAAALGRLTALAFFSGVGAKVTYGMGLALPGAGTRLVHA
jgi:CRISPR-associated endoribonuclease Cas6